MCIQLKDLINNKKTPKNKSQDSKHLTNQEMLFLFHNKPEISLLVDINYSVAINKKLIKFRSRSCQW